MKNKKLAIVGAGLATALIAVVGIYGLMRSGGEDAANRSAAELAPVEETAESATYKQYAAMTGEMYDRNFTANMIAHHQGAVDMAKLAQDRAGRQEIKDMANDIIAAQEQEIASMKAWQQAWGYPSTSADNMQDHAAMGSMEAMSGMTAQLEGKTGEEFDKTFVALMIEHHQSAIDMARPGPTNAQHQELKDLTAEIVRAQTEEVAQLKQWQVEWGYES